VISQKAKSCEAAQKADGFLFEAITRGYKNPQADMRNVHSRGAEPLAITFSDAMHAKLHAIGLAEAHFSI